jgi:hypothetical protein
MRVILILATVLAVSDDTFSRAIVGYWYGENYQPAFHNYFQALGQDRADGTFEVEFRRYENCKLVSRQRESGTWSIANGVVRGETTAIDGAATDRSDPSFRDAYDILKLDEHDFQSRHMPDGTIFKLQRVNAKFRFPDCSFSS